MTTAGSPARSFAIGLDVGTGSVKATVITSDGGTASYGSPPYPTSSPEAGFAEQDPDDWWRAIGEVLARLLADHPDLSAQATTIGLTGQMHTAVARDASGTLLRPAILWSDQRGGADAARLTADVPGIAELTGNAPIPAFTVTHLAWMARNEPQLFARINSVAVPKDDIRRRLGGGFRTEPSDASATGLLDAHTGTWSERICAAIGLPPAALAEIMPSHAPTGVVSAVPTVDPALRRLLGAVIVGGAGDQAAQAGPSG